LLNKRNWYLAVFIMVSRYRSVTNKRGILADHNSSKSSLRKST
jgi:hypothetical protein